MKTLLKLRLWCVMLAVLMVIALLTGCANKDDQESKESPSFTVGFLNQPGRPGHPMFDGFKDGMVERGYIEGENVTYIMANPASVDDYDNAAKSLVDADVDLIFTLARVEGLAAKNATTTIPVIFGPSYFPVEAGLVDSLDQPGGNLTGLFLADSSERRLDLLVESVPGIDKILVFYDPNDPLSASVTQTAQEAVDELGVELVLYTLTDSESAVEAMENLPEGVDAVYLTPARLVFVSNPAWLDLAVERNVAVSTFAGYIDPLYPQLFMGYGSVPYEAGKQASRLADIILSGTNAGDLPVEPAELYFAINLGIANEIGIEVPDGVLQQTDTIVRSDSQ